MVSVIWRAAWKNVFFFYGHCTVKSQHVPSGILPNSCRVLCMDAFVPIEQRGIQCNLKGKAWSHMVVPASDSKKRVVRRRGGHFSAFEK